MNTIDIIDTANEAKARLRVVLNVLGDTGTNEETVDGCVGILWDIFNIIDTLTKQETYVQ